MDGNINRIIVKMWGPWGLRKNTIIQFTRCYCRPVTCSQKLLYNKLKLSIHKVIKILKVESIVFCFSFLDVGQNTVMRHSAAQSYGDKGQNMAVDISHVTVCVVLKQRH